MPDGFLHRQFPEELSDLSELSFDLRWTTSLLTRRIWERLDPEGWARAENPYLILLNASQEQLEEAARDERFVEDLDWWRQKADEYQSRPTWFETEHASSPLKRIAYFSMEFGLSEALPIYSGGLGMLAGDHLKSASDLGVPLVGIGILYQQGYFRQVLAPDGLQREAFPYNDPNSLPVMPLVEHGRWLRVSIELPGRTLILRVWQARVGRVPLYLLDSNDPLNSPWDRGITANLYDAGRDKRLLQEIVLGVGGWRLLEQLGIDVDVCHLNEGHAAFAVLARAAGVSNQSGLSVPEAFRATRAGNVFTTHTPVSAAFDKFDPDLIAHYAQAFLATVSLRVENLLALGRSDPHDASEPFNMAYLAMRGCCHVNGVSNLHGKVSQKLFTGLYPAWPQREIPVGAITNGVHIPTWNSLPARNLWLQTSGDNGWFDDLHDTQQRVQSMETVALWNMRSEARQALVDYARQRFTRQLQIRGTSQRDVEKAAHVLDPNALTLGFARRFTEYKRPLLLLHDSNRLQSMLADSSRPVQLIVAGKAHPNDEHGKQMVRAVTQFSMRDHIRDRIIFLEDYDMVLAQHFAAGIDVWLNTPRRPAEACGTSGMKMLFNGGLNLSVRDGWWDEAWTPDVGWEIGGGREDDPAARDHREAEQLYATLEEQVIPEFYDRDTEGIPHRWVERIRASMSQLTARFCSGRMVKDYVKQAYVPAAKAIQRRVENEFEVAKDLFHWHKELAVNWSEIHFGDVQIHESAGVWRFAVAVYLGDLSAERIRVELYADATSLAPEYVNQMHRSHELQGAVNGFVFTAEAPTNRPVDHYTPRVVPWHPDAFVPAEESQIVWHA